MHIPLRKIGNSRGIILPAAFITACGLKDEVELRLEEKTIVIEPAEKSRSTWFDAYVAEPDIDAWNTVPQDEGIDEWDW